MRIFSVRSALLKVARSLGPSLGIAFALGGPARAQGDATAYAWSAYPKAETTLFFTTGVTVDAADNVYASLLTDHTLVKISPSGTVAALAGSAGVSGAADGTGAAARFNAPQGLAIDGFGAVYAADFGNSTIRKISPTGTVLTLAGLANVRGKSDGPPATARFSSPRGVALDRIGNIYVTDSVNSSIRLITLA